MDSNLPNQLWATFTCFEIRLICTDLQLSQCDVTLVWRRSWLCVGRDYANTWINKNYSLKQPVPCWNVGWNLLKHLVLQYHHSWSYYSSSCSSTKRNYIYIYILLPSCVSRFTWFHSTLTFKQNSHLRPPCPSLTLGHTECDATLLV